MYQSQTDFNAQEINSFYLNLLSITKGEFKDEVQL